MHLDMFSFDWNAFQTTSRRGLSDWSLAKRQVEAVCMGERQSVYFEKYLVCDLVNHAYSTVLISQIIPAE